MNVMLTWTILIILSPVEKMHTVSTHMAASTANVLKVSDHHH